MSLEMWIIIAIIAVLFIGKLLFSSYQTKENSQKDKEKEDKEFKEMDEQLEDYDYLDDITGNDNKWWI